jgi:hypothetical protein
LKADDMMNGHESETRKKYKQASRSFSFSFKWDGEWHFTHSFIHRAARGAFGRWCMNFSIFNKPYAKRVWR